MKLILFVLLVSGSVFGTTREIVVDVRSFEEQSDHYEVTFWEDNRVFRPTKTNSAIPCLRNAFLAPKRVVLKIHQEAGIILDCKLFGAGPPEIYPRAPIPPDVK